MYADKKCGSCENWHKDGQGRPMVNGAVDMSQPLRGFCRAMPPMQQYAHNPQNPGQVMFAPPAYPLLDEQWPACGLYKES